MQRNSYTVGDKFVLRTHLLPFDILQKLYSKDEVDDALLKEIVKDDIIQEAIYLASPVLYRKMEKWLNDDLKKEKDIEKLRLSLLKYMNRMCTRSMPFGVFSGCAVGEWGEDTTIVLREPPEHRKYVVPDMKYLGELSRKLQKSENIRDGIQYYSNNSVYKIANKLRYVEYTFNGESYRNYRIVEVEDSPYLQKLLVFAKKGAFINELVKELTDEGIDREEAYEFVLELIDSQLLISRLEPLVTGEKNLIAYYKTVLKDVRNIENIQNELDSISRQLALAEKKIGRGITNYHHIEQNFRNLDVKLGQECLILSTLEIATEKCSLSNTIRKDLGEALEIMSKVCYYYEDHDLNGFIKNFYQRYEEKEISLLKALDHEIGIGFKSNQYNSTPEPLIDGLLKYVSGKNNKEYIISDTTIYSYLLRKVHDCLSNNQVEMIIQPDEVKDFPASNQFNDTFSSLIKVYKKNDGYEFECCNVGNSSAVNILARFCYGNDKINDSCEEIAEYEESLQGDKILAEIVHLPQSRLGNVLQRPNLRKYAITYLGSTALNPEHIIDPDDLKISAPLGKYIRLRSKSLNKEIIPKLSTAHNYAVGALPVYEFLCRLQHQSKRMGMKFSWETMENDFSFLPRVRYKNIILSLAQWRIETKDILHKIKNTTNENKYIIFNEWRYKWNIPDEVWYVEGDADLYLNLSNKHCIDILIFYMKKGRFINIKEFYHPSGSSVVKGAEGEHLNEILCSFYRKDSEKN